MPAELHVDFLAAEAHGRPGRLGLCAAPGGWRPDRQDPDQELDALGSDLAGLVRRYGVSLLVTLLEPHEVTRLGDLPAAARRLGLAWLHHPIPDMATPPSPADLVPVVQRLDRHLAAGGTAVAHCLAGLGRTGTVAACLLVARGRPADQAVARVRAARPGSIQTLAQERFVSEFQAFWEGGGAPSLGRP